MENFWTVATQVGVLFALMSVGVVCRKTRLLDDVAVKGIVNVLILIVTPSLIVDVFQRPFDRSQLASLALAFLIALAAHLAVILFATAAVRDRRDGTRPVLRLATVFSNAGFMGIPLQQAVFGDDGVFFGIVYVVVFNLMMWSWGLFVMKNEKGETKDEERCGRRVSFFSLPMLVNPGTVGIAVGLPLFFCSVHLPTVLHDPVHYLAGLNTPVAMIAIGYYFAGARLGPVLRNVHAHLAAFVRLVAYPLALTAALWPFRHTLDRTMMLALVTAASAPVAAMTTMFAARYGRDVDTSVGMVCGTTLLSALTMPVVIALAMHFL